MTVLIIAEHDNSELKRATLHSVTAALSLNMEVHIIVAGHNAESVAKSASLVTGVTKVLYTDNPIYEHGLAENIAHLVASIGGAYKYIMATATTAGKNITPRIAALLDVAQISDISGIVDQDTFLRPTYAGNVIATVKSLDTIKVITVRATAFDAAEISGGNATIENIPSTDDFGKSKFLRLDVSASERPELTSAGIIISGGRGMQSGENFVLIESVADKLGAAIGASRAAVDAGFVPNDYQVGQTGKVVAPTLYLAIGISGAIQHLAGMKDSKVIAAINKDEEAPIFQIADYGLVADLFKALPELSDELDNQEISKT
ncbi:MAG: electron transfer flavoprotein subunit alpha [Gammaproteobacteria bacterium]|jgi:electron transfer flavoprotein alpha subunit|nr:electron transfer flavoprotein subunit alpha [Gammaproteobacteria bacterium]|tara:strand:+ start:5652 stop:6605 length:954 start_codon:yes stop_codon:yes gene_type:complete